MVVVPSEFTRTGVRQELGSRFAVQVVRGGVGARLLSHQPSQRFPKPYFLHVGHLEPRKNLGTLLSAYALFVQLQGPHGEVPELVLVGADAEDAWSETFLSAMRAYPELRPDSNLRGWRATDHAGAQRPQGVEDRAQALGQQGQHRLLVIHGNDDRQRHRHCRLVLL